MSDYSCDIAIIGAGIAGASAAALLSRHGKVMLFDQEMVAGYHTTGRSAAVFAPCYGPPSIRALTQASRSFFLDPDQEYFPTPLVSERPILLIARSDQLKVLDQVLETLSSDSNVRRLDQSQVESHTWLLRAGYASAGILDSSGLDIDVAALHQGYLRQFKKSAGSLLTNARVNAIHQQRGGWHIQFSESTVHADVIVNAAGAWADEIAALAGVRPVGLVPKRRTAIMVDSPSGVDTRNMPITIDIEEQFYLKPEGVQLLISPADETPSIPCDAQPEEIDVAICIDRICNAFSLNIQRPGRQWAGLRSFVRDGEPVVGFARDAAGFFWLAGQGGYGIQTAPAMAALAESLINGQTLSRHISDTKLDPETLGSDRDSLH